MSCVDDRDLIFFKSITMTQLMLFCLFD